MNAFKIKSEKYASPEWLDELKKTVEVTYEVLNELQNSGYPYKDLTEVVLTDIKCPVWTGISKTDGYIKIDPSKHDTRAVAHELGHGFEERWRRTEDKKRGESMSEAVRYFVEEKMGERKWSCPEPHKRILEICDYDFNTFRQKLSTDEFRKSLFILRIKKIIKKYLFIIKKYLFIIIIIGVVISAGSLFIKTASFYDMKPEVLINEYGYNKDKSEYIFRVENSGKTLANDIVLSVYYLYRSSPCPNFVESSLNYDGVHKLPRGKTQLYLVPLFPFDLYKNIMNEDLCRKELEDKIKSEGLLTRIELSYKWSILLFKKEFREEYIGLLTGSGFQLY